MSDEKSGSAEDAEAKPGYAPAICSAVEVRRDKYGMWMHPAFNWDILDEQDPTQFFRFWRYVCAFRSLEHDAPDEIQERYANSNDPDCSYWHPEAPDGIGWFLAAIYDTEDGPVSLWVRPEPPDSD